MMMDDRMQKKPSQEEFFDAKNDMVLPLHMIRVYLNSSDDDYSDDQYSDYAREEYFDSVEEECSEPENITRNIVLTICSA